MSPRKERPNVARDAADVIWVVSGLPRSGTSMMMQLLEAGGLGVLSDGVRSPGEDNPRGYYEFEPVKRTREDASWVPLARGKAVKVVSLLLSHLPADHRYRVILMRRDLREVVASQQRMLERHGTTGANLSAEQLIAVYERQFEQTRQWLTDSSNVEFIEVDYGEFVRDPAAGVEATNRFAGGGLDTAAMMRGVDPALHRQRSVQGGLILLLILGGLIASSLVGERGTGADTQFAYIGPGAGIALIGSFFAVFSALVSSLFYVVSWPVRVLWRGLRSRKAYRKARVKRVVILGLDGLSPDITERLLDEGRLPNLAKLRDAGTYTRLGTTCPPLSPVAWSSFSTGTNPGKHNIYDFISRNPQTYRPTQSSVRVQPSRRSLRLGRFVVPLGRPRIEGLRKSKPVWSVLSEAGIASAVLRVPITYPPDRFRGVQLSAMCVPDLRGTHGTFSYYAENGATGHTTDGDVGGDLIAVERNGKGVSSFLRRPENSFRVGAPELQVPFRVEPGRNGAARMRIDGQKIDLPLNQYSDWVRVSFRLMPGVRMRGVCRFRLKRLEAPFEMYCTPIQIDPNQPVMPISHPRIFSIYLARLLGTYSTLGLAEDTWALSEGKLTDDAFLEQAYGIHEERKGMFFDALRRVRRGLVVCVFDGPDRIQHMFWRYLDDDHPAMRNGERESHAHVIDEMYERMDELVGQTMDELDEDTALFVMSDHGFTSFRRCVDLNAWLLDNGYLALKEGAERPGGTYLADVDWSRTRAYALGLAGLFINREGRERDGTVPAPEAKRLAEEIAAKLTGLRDPDRGEVAVHEAMPRETMYDGPYVESAPDVIVGYSRGYRVSWESAIGKCAATVFSDNCKAWSGDHCIHPALLPGVLFSNIPLQTDHAQITDLAPTTLELLGADEAAYMDGRSLLCAE